MEISADIQKHVQDGFIEFFKWDCQCSPLQTAFFKKQSNVVYYSTGINYAPMNGVFEDHSSNSITETEIDSAIALFSSKNLPFVWWTDQNKLLEQNGFQFGGIMKGISLEMSKFNFDFAEPKDVRIKKIENEKELNDFMKVMGESFGLKDFVVDQMEKVSLGLFKKGMDNSFIAYDDKKPVSVVGLTMDGTAGIWNFATVPDYRGRGIGTALLNRCLLEARNRNYQNVMAILMPKGMAASAFRKLGFQEICDFPFYIFGANEPIE